MGNQNLFGYFTSLRFTQRSAGSFRSHLDSYGSLWIALGVDFVYIVVGFPVSGRGASFLWGLELLSQVGRDNDWVGCGVHGVRVGAVAGDRVVGVDWPMWGCPLSSPILFVVRTFGGLWGG